MKLIKEVPYVPIKEICVQKGILVVLLEEYNCSMNHEVDILVRNVLVTVLSRFVMSRVCC